MLPGYTSWGTREKIKLSIFSCVLGFYTPSKSHAKVDSIGLAFLSLNVFNYSMFVISYTTTSSLLHLFIQNKYKFGILGNSSMLRHNSSNEVCNIGYINTGPKGLFLVTIGSLFIIFWNGSHAISHQKGMFFTNIIIPQNYKLGCIIANVPFFFLSKKVVSIDLFGSQIVCFRPKEYIRSVQCFLFVTSQLVPKSSNGDRKQHFSWRDNNFTSILCARKTFLGKYDSAATLIWYVDVPNRPCGTCTYQNRPKIYMSMNV